MYFAVPSSRESSVNGASIALNLWRSAPYRSKSPRSVAHSRACAGVTRCTYLSLMGELSERGSWLGKASDAFIIDGDKIDPHVKRLGIGLILPPAEPKACHLGK